MIVRVTNLNSLETTGGSVKHFLKITSEEYHGFGEVYFSSIRRGVVRGWKLHREMTMNLVVPVGSVRFVFFNELAELDSKEDYIIGVGNYVRLTVPPLTWCAFRGMGDGDNLIANVASIVHSPEELERRELDTINCDWGDK